MGAEQFRETASAGIAGATAPDSFVFPELQDVLLGQVQGSFHLVDVVGRQPAHLQERWVLLATEARLELGIMKMEATLARMQP